MFTLVGAYEGYFPLIEMITFLEAIRLQIVNFLQQQLRNISHIIVMHVRKKIMW